MLKTVPFYGKDGYLEIKSFRFFLSLHSPILYFFIVKSPPSIPNFSLSYLSLPLPFPFTFRFSSPSPSSFLPLSFLLFPYISPLLGTLIFFTPTGGWVGGEKIVEYILGLPPPLQYYNKKWVMLKDQTFRTMKNCLNS